MIDNINPGYVCERKWLIKDDSLNLKNIESGSKKKLKKVLFLKKVKTTGLIKKIRL